jgi:hypothetical protein
MTSSYPCQQRTSGAKNWEAYIRDSRDNKIYRITQFSDGSWWMAEDMNNATKVKYTCSGVNLYTPLDKPDCPSGWILPTMAKIKARWPAGYAADNYGGQWAVGPYVHGGCGTQPVNCHPLSSSISALFTVASDCNVCLHMYANSSDWLHHCSASLSCNTTAEASGGRVRCYRQL